MDFQIHRFPISATRLDLVVVANFPQEEADAIEESRSWGRVCVMQIYTFRAFFADITRRRITFRQLIKPGMLLENFDPSYADTFQEKFTLKYAAEAYDNLLPIITDYRRKMHREHERQRDEFMNLSEPLHIGHQPRVSIIAHDQRYLPTS